MERLDASAISRLDHSERTCRLQADWNGGDGDASAGRKVMLDHLAHIHAIDVVGAEDTHEVGCLVADQVQVLIDRIGGTRKPVRAASHLRGHRGHVVAKQAAEAPRRADVAVETVALVLREHDDLEVSRVGEVGEREVDDAIVAAERDRRFRAIVSQRHHALALAASQHNDQHLRF